MDKIYYINYDSDYLCTIREYDIIFTNHIFTYLHSPGSLTLLEIYTDTIKNDLSCRTYPQGYYSVCPTEKEMSLFTLRARTFKLQGSLSDILQKRKKMQEEIDKVDKIILRYKTVLDSIEKEL